MTTVRVTKLSKIIVDLLKRDGPMHTPAICIALDRDYARTVPIMTALQRKGAIEIVGKAGALGYTDVASRAPVYAATGVDVVIEDVQREPKQGVSELPPPDATPPTRRRNGRTNSGSGVIAGPITIGSGYRWGSRRW